MIDIILDIASVILSIATIIIVVKIWRDKK